MVPNMFANSATKIQYSVKPSFAALRQALCFTHIFFMQNAQKRISIPVRPEAFFIRKEKKRSRGIKNGTNDKQVNIRLIALDMAMAYSKNSPAASSGILIFLRISNLWYLFIGLRGKLQGIVPKAK